MSSPRDYYKEIFGSEPDKKETDKFETIDLDELLNTIDKELGETPKGKDSAPLDYDYFNDIFGDKKEEVQSESRPLMTENSAPRTNNTVRQDEVKYPEIRKTKAPSNPLLEETKAIPSIRPSSTALKSAERSASSDSAKPSRRYERLGSRASDGKVVLNKNEDSSDNTGSIFSKFRLTGIRYVIFVLIVSILLAYFSWMFVNDVFALNKPYVMATITVPQNYNMTIVANELKKAKIIKYPTLFKLFGAIAKADKKIDPGMYKLTSELDYRAIVATMQEGSSDEVVKITIPEGKTMNEIFALLEEKGVCTSARLKETATSYNFKYKFLNSDTVGESKRLEGYLFPDTYEFYLNETAVNVLKKFLDNFDTKVTDDMYAKAKQLGYDMKDIITIASLIEKESANDDESAKIASVIYNRLKSSSFPYLQIDATVQYALPERKAKLTEDDLKVDSPYNTYKHKGLPPTAIASPGIVSIKAALSPEKTSYYFYALNKNGNHSFFESSSAFDKFVSSADYGG